MPVIQQNSVYKKPFNSIQTGVFEYDGISGREYFKWMSLKCYSKQLTFKVNLQIDFIIILQSINQNK